MTPDGESCLLRAFLNRPGCASRAFFLLGQRKPGKRGDMTKAQKKWQQNPVQFQWNFDDYIVYQDKVAELRARFTPKIKTAEPLKPNGESLEVPGWTEEEIKGLHSYLLTQSLRALKQRNGSMRTKKDILRWILKPLNNAPEIFSFQLCCELEGVDPFEMTITLRETIDSDLLPGEIRWTI